MNNSITLAMQGRVRLLSLLNLPAWGLLPYFALPSRGIDLIVGVSQTIYGEALINLPTPVPSNFSVIYTCEIGTQSGNNLVLNPVVGNIGSHSVTAVFKLGNLTITTKTFNLNVYAAQSGSVKVLMVGDSLIYLGYTDIATGLDSALTLSISFTGSLGTTIKHDGVPGANYESILTVPGTTYPNHLVNVNVLDLANYFTTYSVDIPDFVLIRFGVNDVNLPVSFPMTDSYMNTHIIAKAKLLVDAFLAYNSTLKIIVGLPTISENSGVLWNADYDEVTYPQNTYIQNIHRMWDALITAFDNSAYSTRVIVSNEAIFLSRDVDAYNNGVHLKPLGSQQLGSGIAPTINQQMSLVPSGLTLSLISGGVKIDWTDNSSGTFETEIWGKNDSDAYALLYTIAAGTVTKSETIDAVDLRYYKIRSKNGDYYTPFSPEQSIAMLGSELVLNGNFSAWTADNPNDWTVYGEGANGTITEVAGKCRIIVTDSGVGLTQVCLTTGTKYRFKVNVVEILSGECVMKTSSVVYQRFATIGQKTFYAVTDNNFITFSRWTGNTDFTIDDVSAKRVLMP